MERRVCPRILAASIDFLFRGPVLDEIVRLLFQHKRYYFKENTAKRENIGLLGLMRS
jgi:hypothetical protein